MPNISYIFILIKATDTENFRYKSEKFDTLNKISRIFHISGI